MDNPAFQCDDYFFKKTIEAEEKLLLSKLNEAYNNKNLDRFRGLLRKSLMKRVSRKLSCKISETCSENINRNISKSFNLFEKISLKMKPKISVSANVEYKMSRKLLFVRKNDNELNLFEKILLSNFNGNGEFISLVWIECELWRDDTVLVKTNPIRKIPIDFVIESGSDENLFHFLIYNFQERNSRPINTDNNYYLKLKNHQLENRTGMSIFQKIYSIINRENQEKCICVIEELLMEMKEITDIKRDVDIDTIIKLQVEEKIKETILKRIVKHWKVDSNYYLYYRNILVELSPYYEMFLLLKENNEEDFEDNFSEYLDYMKAKHAPEHFDELLQDDCNSLLTFALNHGQKKAMKVLISCYAVDVNKFTHAISMASCETSFFNNEYAMLKLLEKGYYVGYEEDEKVCKDGNWINAKVFEQFLDSCVTSSSYDSKFSNINEYNVRGIQIDYTFLIAPEIRPIGMKNLKDQNDMILFSEGMRPLELILNNEKLRHLITHPVLSSFINLKSFKFSQIYNLNLYMFVFFYVLPFLLVFIYYDAEDTEMLRILIPALTSTLYLTIREAIQFFWIIDNKIEYFKKKSNKLEMLMIFSSWWLVVALISHSYHSYQISSAFIILFATIELLAILPYSSLSIYMFMLKTVSITFLKFFTIFILIILAFTFSFYAILKPIKHLHEKHTLFNNETQNIASHESVFKNFEHPFTSFIKTILMFAGDFSVDPYKLDSFWKQILFLCFVLTAFILYNLINGLAISDIQKLKEDAEFLNLKQRIRTTVDCENIICNLYWKLSGIKKPNELDIEKGTCEPRPSCWNKAFKKVLSIMVNRYPYLHKMENLWVDFKYKNVSYKINQKLEPILKMSNGKEKCYLLNEESYKRLLHIIKEKTNKSSDMGDRIEFIDHQIRSLKEDIKYHHDELKKTLYELITTRS